MPTRLCPERARVWEAANRETYAGTWAKLIGLPKQIPLRWFSGANTRPVPIDAEVVAAEQRTIDLYVRNGLIPKPLKAADVLDPSFNPAVLSGAQEAVAQ